MRLTRSAPTAPLSHRSIPLKFTDAFGCSEGSSTHCYKNDIPARIGVLADEIADMAHFLF